MWVTISVSIFLILNFLSIYKIEKHFSEKEVFQGIQFIFYSIATFIVLIFLIHQLDIKFSILQLLLTTYLTAKIFNLLLVTGINIYLAKSNKSFASSIFTLIIILIIIFMYFFITKDYKDIEPSTLIFIDALTYPFYGVIITQWLKSKKRCKLLELWRRFCDSFLF